MIEPFSKSRQPILWRARAGITDQIRAISGSHDERVERLEGQCWNAIFYFERDKSRPGDSYVEAIVGLQVRSIRGIVRGSGREPHAPVFGSGNLRRVRFVAVNESP